MFARGGSGVACCFAQSVLSGGSVWWCPVLSGRPARCRRLAQSCACRDAPRLVVKCVPQWAHGYSVA